MNFEEVSDRCANDSSSLHLDELISQKVIEYKFIGKKHLQEENDDHILHKPMAEIITLDPTRKELQKPTTPGDFGTKAKSIFI